MFTCTYGQNVSSKVTNGLWMVVDLVSLILNEIKIRNSLKKFQPNFIPKLFVRFFFSLFFWSPKSLKTLQLMNKIKAQNVINHNYHIISYLPCNSCLRAFFTWRWGTCLGGLTRLSIWSLILISSRLHVRWGNPLHVTTPTWGPPPPCKQALSRDTFGSVKICLFWQFWVQEFSADAS